MPVSVVHINAHELFYRRNRNLLPLSYGEVWAAQITDLELYSCTAVRSGPSDRAASQREVGRAHGRERAGGCAWMAGQGLFEPFPRHVTTHKTSVSRCVMRGGGGVTAQQHRRSHASGMLGSAGRTTDLADSFGAGS